MAALPGLTTTSLTKEWTKALVSVSSLVLRIPRLRREWPM